MPGGNRSGVCWWGGPTQLVHDGQILHDRVTRHGLTVADVEQAVRQHEREHVEQVRFAVPDADGEITVVPWPGRHVQPAADSTDVELPARSLEDVDGSGDDQSQRGQ